MTQPENRKVAMTDEELLEAARRLVRLMEDPQYGLLTWNDMRNNVAKQLYAGLHERLSEPEQPSKPVFRIKGEYNPRVAREWRNNDTPFNEPGWYGRSPDGLSFYGPYPTQKEAENMPPMAATINVTGARPITNEELLERDVLVCAYGYARGVACSHGNVGLTEWLPRADRLEIAIAKWDKAHEGRPFADRDLNG